VGGGCAAGRDLVATSARSRHRGTRQPQPDCGERRQQRRGLASSGAGAAWRWAANPNAQGASPSCWWVAEGRRHWRCRAMAVGECERGDALEQQLRWAVGVRGAGQPLYFVSGPLHYSRQRRWGPSSTLRTVYNIPLRIGSITCRKFLDLVLNVPNSLFSRRSEPLSNCCAHAMHKSYVQAPRPFLVKVVNLSSLNLHSHTRLATRMNANTLWVKSKDFWSDCAWNLRSHSSVVNYLIQYRPTHQRPAQ
jgi:hypothetical protein